MYLLIATEYSFLAGCLEDKPKSQISESFAPISAFIITRIHPNQHSGHGETVVAVSGSNQTAGISKHGNYIIYMVGRYCMKDPLTGFRTRLLSRKPAENWMRNKLGNLAPTALLSFIFR
jgi:hypothetical protein